MKKILYAAFLICLNNVATAQYDAKPTSSRFWNNNKSSFTLAPGDVLKYAVNVKDSQYTYAITVTEFGNEIQFDYAIPEINAGGTMHLAPDAITKTNKYDTLLLNQKTVLKDENILWLSKRNFRDLWSSKHTTMNMGVGNERFERINTSTLKIKYKGQEKIITVYDVENAGTKTKKKLAVLTNEGNPLIIKMDLGWTLTLKEVI